MLSVLFVSLCFMSVLANSDNIKGDVNGNGKIDMTDYILVKRVYFNTYIFDEQQLLLADINDNGKIDMTDYILLKRIYFGTYSIDGNTENFEEPQVSQTPEISTSESEADNSRPEEPNLIMGEEISGVTFQLGDRMYDFTLTTPDGDELVLADILKEKKAVVLNFWFSSCYWCQLEFPYMNDAYNAYKDDIEIIALNPYDGDAAVEQFKTENGISFPMVFCSYDMASAFSVSGYPTTVVIDRNGIVSMNEAGAVTQSGVFEDLFAYFTADDYRSEPLESITDIYYK